MPRDLVFEKPFLAGRSPALPLSDLALNLLGFVPFGFLVSLRIAAAGRLSGWGCGWRRWPWDLE
jgi:hypothetical protein